jgi:prepilin-type N-terminal cleavage/methylation domain-containing protein
MMIPGRSKHNFKGFTLVELLVALMVSSIIFAAVATLAYVLGSANKAAGDVAEKQAQVRYATLRISELVGHCKLVCGIYGDSLTVWRADDNGDGQININELVCIEKGEASNYLKLGVFSATSPVNLSSIGMVVTGGFYSVTYAPLIPQCSNVEFQLDALPPYSRFVNISFDLVENCADRQYQISVALRCWAGNLLNETGSAVVSDDD